MPSPVRPIVAAVLGTLAVIAALFWQGPAYPEALHPTEGRYGDYVMYWLSARNYYAGFPVYDSQPAALARYYPDRPFDPKSGFLAQHNTHPPPSILLALPFAGLDYRDAHCAWDLVTLVPFLLGVGLAVREVGGRFWPCYLPPTFAFVLWADPVFASAWYGQPNFLLAGLLTLGWVADRRGYGLAAGACVGLATAIKLIPGLLFVHFLLTGRWRAMVAGVVVVLAMTGLAAGIFGLDAFRTHQQVSLPDLSEYQGSWMNQSINGVVQKLLDPNPIQTGGEPYPHRNPVLAKGVVGGLDLLVLGALAWAIRRGRHAGPDAGWAACLPAVLLLSPITWWHYFVLLVVTFAVLFARLRGPLRWVLGVAAVGVSIAPQYYWMFGVSPEQRRAGLKLGLAQFVPLSPAECVGLLAAPTYLTVLLFLLAVIAAARGGRGVNSAATTPADAPHPSPSPAGTPAPSPPPGP